MSRVSLAAALLISVNLCAADSLSDWFAEGKGYGKIKYYYIETNKELADFTKTSAHAHSLGGQLGYRTGDYNGFQAAVTMMTTNPFWLPGRVDTSIIGKDNGLLGKDPTKGFAVVGEAYLNYSYENFTLSGGRKVIKTPLINAKEVRMLPSAVEGYFADIDLKYGTKVELAYITRFKQRTSDSFMNIVEHALGAATRAVTGDDRQNVWMAGAKYSKDNYSVKIYDYYATDFLNSIYIQSDFKNSYKDYDYKFSFQYINQTSVGNAEDNLVLPTSPTGGEDISVNAFGARLAFARGGTSASFAYSKVLKDEGSHDSLVLPWDGTPLFTNMITANNLFQSNYGKALNSDSAYIGGTQGVRIGIKQNLSKLLPVEGWSLSLACARYTNGRFESAQRDLNAVLGYKKERFSLAFKGIWVNNPASATAQNVVTQIDSLTQYRVIASYSF